MYKATRCLACDGEDLHAHPALVAPFIATYVLHAAPRPTRLLECGACGLRFFQERYEPAEVAALYRDYRGVRYFEERHRLEPWYSRRVNDRIGGDPDEIRRRKDRAWKFMSQEVDAGEVTSILDYGGDRGQFIPDAFTARRTVHDISGVEPMPGVEAVRTAADLAGRKFDLVLIQHVLEHCADPIEVVREVKALPAGGRATFFVEVPHELPSLAWNWPASRYPGYLDALSRTGPLLLAVDFLSTSVRLTMNLVPPFGFAKQHEHLTFFSPASMRALLERAGLSVRRCEVVRDDLPAAVLCVAEAA